VTAARPGSVAMRPGAGGRWRRSVAAAGALLVAAAGLALAAPAADAAACSGSTGVTVVVDFGSLGGGVQTGCAAGDPASGLAALTGAGHTYAFVPRFFGLVCQIDGRPNPCNGAPSTAYWSYWHADRGGSWVYSKDGAGTYQPHPGTVEGWAFGAGRRPGIAPPPAPAPKPTTTKPPAAPAPEPTTKPPAAPAPPGTSAAAAPTPGAPGTSAGRAPRRAAPGSAPAGSAGRTTAAPSTSAGPVTDATSASSTGAGAAPSTSDSGSPGAVVTEPASLSSTRKLGAFALAVALIGALALAGVLIARRRRIGPP
jgi:hypothetical protein